MLKNYIFNKIKAIGLLNFFKLKEHNKFLCFKN